MYFSRQDLHQDQAAELHILLQALGLYGGP